MTMRRFKNIGEGLIESAWIGDARERHLSHILKVILLLLVLCGVLFEILYRSGNRPFGMVDILMLAVIGILSLAYILNRRGSFVLASLLTHTLCITAVFSFTLFLYRSGSANLAVLYYLVIPILMSELFFSMRGYLISSVVILAGVFGLSLLVPGAGTIFIFLFVFCVLIGFSSYNRRLIDREQHSLTQRFEHEQFRLSMEQRKAAHLRLLAEVGGLVTDSLDEKEILERTLQAIVNQQGYAGAAISMLLDDALLEVAAISDSRDDGSRPGSPPTMESGITGQVARTRKAHIAGDVSHDPASSSTIRQGSALGVPMLDKENLLGVIYVESARKNELQEEDVQTLQTVANQVATSIQKARLYARTQDHLRVMTTLQSISHTVASSLELDEILNNVIRLLKESFGYTYLGIYVLERDVLYLGAQLGYPENMLIPEIPITAGVMGRTARSKETQFIHDVSTDPDFLRLSYEVKSEIAVPLLKDDNVLGVLNVESDRHKLLGENDVNLLNALAGQIAVALDNARLHAEVKRMALTDVVSGLANRRAFDEVLEAEILRANRYRHALSLIILDLDSFKDYNDRWGHPAGDVRLREIADLLRLNVRDPDIAARYGGEEFAVILPNTSKPGAVRLAERLRQSAEESAPQTNGSSAPVAGYTISLGVATFPDDATSLEELLLMADNAELMAKRLGKNRVYAANSSDTIRNR